MTADPTQNSSSSTARGSLGKGILYGVLMLLGGYVVMYLVLPNLGTTQAFLTFAITPWAALIALVVHFRRKSESRTAGGLGIAGAIVIGILLLLFGLLVLMLSLSGHH